MGVVYRPTYSTFLADMCRHADELDRGLVHVESALALMEKSGERWFESVTLGVQANILSIKNSSPELSLSDELAVSLQRARSQQARQLELVINSLHDTTSTRRSPSSTTVTSENENSALP